MNEIIANLVIENFYQEVKIRVLAEILFENNIISKNEFNNKFSKLLEDKDFLKKQLNKTMSEDEFPKLFNSILNNSIFK